MQTNKSFYIIFIAALFVMTKNWNQVSINRWKNKQKKKKEEDEKTVEYELAVKVRTIDTSNVVESHNN